MRKIFISHFFLLLLLLSNSVFAADFYVGVIGQSNSVVGWKSASMGGGTDSGTPNALCHVSTNGTNWSAPGYSASIAFCNKLAETLGIDIRMILLGVSGSSLNTDNNIGFGYWLGASSPSQFAPYKTVVDATGHDMDATVWIQGETEGAFDFSSSYQSDLATFFSQIRTGTGASTKIIVSGLNAYLTGGNWATIEGNQEAACTADGSAVFVDMSDLGVGALHYSADDNITVGTRLATSLINSLNSIEYATTKTGSGYSTIKTGSGYATVKKN